MGGDFELVEHGGDLGLRGWGATAGEAASQLLLALWAAMYGEEPPPPPSRWDPWKAPADLPLPMATVELLSEALYRASVMGEAVVALDGDPRGARLGLAPIPDGLQPVQEVKAVTYNDPRFERLPDGSWLGRLTLDL